MKVHATMEEVQDGTNGGCLACGEIQYGGVEPDARGYPCDVCGEDKVFGLEELIVMDMLVLDEEE